VFYTSTRLLYIAHLNSSSHADLPDRSVSLGERKTFSVQGSRMDGRADGFSETSSMFAAAKVVSSARPLAGHAVTLARVEKYTPVGGERVRGCVCKEIPSKTPRSHGYREPHGKHRG